MQEKGKKFILVL